MLDTRQLHCTALHWNLVSMVKTPPNRSSQDCRLLPQPTAGSVTKKRTGLGCCISLGPEKRDNQISFIETFIAAEDWGRGAEQWRRKVYSAQCSWLFISVLFCTFWGCTELSLHQVRCDQIRFGQSRFGQIRFAQIRFGHIRCDQIRFGQISYDQFRCGQIKCYQIGSGQNSCT